MKQEKTHLKTDIKLLQSCPMRSFSRPAQAKSGSIICEESVCRNCSGHAHTQKVKSLMWMTKELSIMIQ